MARCDSDGAIDCKAICDSDGAIDCKGGGPGRGTVQRARLDACQLWKRRPFFF